MQAPDSPIVSVLMSVFNGSQYLSKAVESILGQTCRDFEFLIVDDGSSDGSLEILRRHASRDSRIRIIGRENTGLTRALNEGVSVARGQFIARMDADDMAEPDRLARQALYLHEHPNCLAVGSRLLLIDPDGDPLGEAQPPETHDAIVASLLSGIGAIPHPSAMIRRGALNAVGGYREEFAYAQDLDLWLRLSDYGSLANLNQPLLRYRLHCQSITSQRREQQLACAEKAVRDAFQRRGQTVTDGRRLPVAESPSVGQVYRNWALMAWRSGNKRVAQKHAKNALAAAPYSWKSLGLVAKVFLPHLKKAA